MLVQQNEEMDKTSRPRIYVEKTLALIKPDAIHKAEEIEDIILKSGFTILQVGLSVWVYAVWCQEGVYHISYLHTFWMMSSCKTEMRKIFLRQ